MDSAAFRQSLDAKIRYMTGVFDELIALAAEENRRLSSRPLVSIEDLVVRKRELTQELDSWIKTVRANPDILVKATPDVATEHLERNRQLAEALSENSQLLNKTLAASRRRTQTIIRAIREQRALPAGYAGNGQYRPAGNSPISIGSGYKA